MGFLMKNKKDVKNEEEEKSNNELVRDKDESSASYDSQTQLANLAATTNETSITTKNTKSQSLKENKLVGFMTTAETAAKNVLDNVRDAFQKATSKRKVAVVTEDLGSDDNKKKFEEQQQNENDTEETPVVKN